MNKKDILVGRTYTHSAYPDIVYLGVAIHADQEESARIIRKDLVIISKNSEKIGENVLKLSGNKEFWNGFHLTNS